MIDPSNLLSARLPTCATTFLAHLRYLPAPQTALRALDLHISASDPAVTATLLATALIAHSSLTALALTGPFICDATLATLQPALLRLPAMHSLCLTQGRLTSAALPDLQRILSKSSSLRHFALSGLTLPSDPPLCPSEAASVTPLLAAATLLTSLHLDGTNLCGDCMPRGAAAAPLATLPHVRKLKLYETNTPRRAGTPLLPTLSLPAVGNLTLSLRDHHRGGGDCKSGSLDSRSYALRVKPALAHVSTLTALEVLTVDTADWGGSEESAHSTLAASLRALPALVGLDMHAANSCSAVRALTPFLKASSRLVVLRLRTSGGAVADTDGSTAAPWEPFMHALAQHTTLQELELPHDASLFHSDTGAVPAPQPGNTAAESPPASGPLLVTLPQLRQMTRLVLMPRHDHPDPHTPDHCWVDCRRAPSMKAPVFTTKLPHAHTLQPYTLLIHHW